MHHCCIQGLKYPNMQGDGEAHAPHAERFVDQIWSSCAYWIYWLLVMRGSFVALDHILHAGVGNKLTVRPLYKDYYSFVT